MKDGIDVRSAAVKRSKVEWLREAIEQDIVTGVYAPGERLDETQLAARHAVSRTPIREALMQLSAMGVVRVVPHKGTFVNKLTLTELVGMFEVMAELEGMCARLAARRVAPEQIAALEETQVECRAACDEGHADRYYYANEQFHRLIYGSSGNAYLTSLANSLHTRLTPYRRLQLRVPGRLSRSAVEHDEILAAIRAREPEAAEKLIKRHIVVQGDSFSDFLVAISSGTAPMMTHAVR